MGDFKTLDNTCFGDRRKRWISNSPNDRLSRRQVSMSDTQKTIEQLSALAQHTRFAIFQSLMRAGQDGMSAGAIAKALDVAPNTLSSHLAIITRADLASVTREGRSQIYKARIDGVNNLLSALVEDCCNGHPEICVTVTGLSKVPC